jgi:hypothetical protein
MKNGENEIMEGRCQQCQVVWAAPRPDRQRSAPCQVHDHGTCGGFACACECHGTIPVARSKVERRPGRYVRTPEGIIVKREESDAWPE